jgi:hypothetical protein
MMRPIVKVSRLIWEIIGSKKSLSLWPRLERKRKLMQRVLSLTIIRDQQNLPLHLGVIEIPSFVDQ